MYATDVLSSLRWSGAMMDVAQECAGRRLLYLMRHGLSFGQYRSHTRGLGGAVRACGHAVHCTGSASGQWRAEANDCLAFQAQCSRLMAQFATYRCSVTLNRRDTRHGTSRLRTLPHRSTSVVSATDIPSPRGSGLSLMSLGQVTECLPLVTRLVTIWLSLVYGIPRL